MHDLSHLESKTDLSQPEDLSIGGVERATRSLLTPQDRELLSISKYAKRERFGFGTRPAILIIDNIYLVLGDKRQPILEAVDVWPMSCGISGWRAIDKTAELIRSARALDVPVIYANIIPDLTAEQPTWRGRSREGMLDGLTPDQRSKAFTIVSELTPDPSDKVILKAAASAFAGTPLAFHLQYLRVDTVLVAGNTTSGCVRATVVDGSMRRYRMGVVEDCCFDRIEAAHSMNLFDMDQKYADVITEMDVVRYLESNASGD